MSIGKLRRSVTTAVLSFTMLVFPCGNVSAATELQERSETAEVENTDQQETTGAILKAEKLMKNKAAAGGTTYYIDAEGGNDDNDGTSAETAWQTFDVVNKTEFQPGDAILLKSGSTWKSQTLAPKGSGTESEPILISSYGSGDKPLLEGEGSVADVLYLCNQEYWEIENLEISNKTSGFNGKNGEALKDVRGIHITGQDSGKLSGFDLHDLYIHDVTGTVNWISGSTDGDAATPGIVHKSGWDGSKRTGGIVFEILQPGTGPKETYFNDIMIKDNMICDNSFGGIIIKQWNGSAETNEHWAQRDGGDAGWVPHTNVTIQDNYMSQYNSDYACNTIYLTSTKGAMIQRNVSAGAGVCGIELYYTDDVTIQYNEVYDTEARAGGADSNGIDPDKEATNAVIQYNYVHDTGDGILLCGFIFGDAVVRYNVIKDAGKRFINPHSDKGEYLVYNNIFYNTSTTRNSVDFVASSGGNDKYLNDSNCFYKFYNNIFYNAAEKEGQTVIIGTGSGTTYSNNDYYGNGLTIPNDDTSALSADPCFIGEAPDTRGTQETGPLLELNGLQLEADSPAIEAGLTVGKGEEKDFFGNSLFNGLPDIGIMEYQGENNGKECLSGYVKDEYGNRIAGAAVQLDGTALKAVSNEQGYYAVKEVPEGTYSVTISKNGYEDGKAENIVVNKGNITRAELTIGGSFSKTGSIAGTVTDYDGIAIKGAKVSVSINGQVYSGETDDKGMYTINEVPIGSGYQIEAAMTGYLSAGQTGAVQPQTTTALNFKLTKNQETNYVIDEDFESYAIGSFEGNDLWVSSPGNGEITIADNGDGTKSLVLSRAAGLSSGKTIVSKSGLGLSGVVTAEIRVKKTGSGYYTLPFLYSKTDTSNPVATLVFEKGEIKTHINGKNAKSLMPYEENKWYDCRVIVNTDTGIFDVYVNDKLLVNQQKVRNAKSDIDQIALYAEKVSTGTVYIDKVKLCEGYPADMTEASLSSLSADGLVLEKKDALHYEAAVSGVVDKVKITANAASLYSTIKVNGEAVESGAASEDIVLGDGSTIIPVEVTAGDHSTKKNYTITIKRISTDVDATLMSLVPSTGQLMPVFSSKEKAYTMSVPYETKEISFTATTSVSGANVKINNKAAVSGKASEGIALNTGENTVLIEVSSVDGTETEYYTVVVTREEKLSAITYFDTSAEMERKAGIYVKADVTAKKDADHDGSECIVFELFKGDQPVNMVCVRKDIKGTEEAEVYFNVADYTDSSYCVKVFILDSFNQTELPVSLADTVSLS